MSSLSCVIPVFNGARFLGAAIDSVLAQSPAAFEIIVVDDGSTDATADVARSYGSRVVYLQQPNQGAPRARNRGIERATGEFIALLDSDDIWHPNKTALQLERFAARPELAISTTHMRNFCSAGIQLDDAGLEDPRLADDQPSLGSSLIARRSVFETIGLLDTSLKHRDIQEFVVRAQDLGYACETLPQVLVQRRIHDANASRHRGRAGEFELLQIARARMARRRTVRA